MSDPDPAAKQAPYRVTHALEKRATRGDPASDVASGDVARSEAKPSEAHQARSGRSNPVGKSGSTPDFPTSIKDPEAWPHALRSSRPRLVNIGYGNLLAASRIVAIIAPNAAPMRRLRREAADRGKLVDATEGRRTRSIVLLDSDHVVLSAILPDTLAARLTDDDAERGA